MESYCWKSKNGEFHINIKVGGEDTKMLWDTGFIDPDCNVGLGLDEVKYNRLKRDGKLTNEKQYSRHLANCDYDLVDTGEVEAQLIHNGKTCGPKIKVRVRKGATNSVGYCFFKALRSCQLIWEFEADEICIECRTE